MSNNVFQYFKNLLIITLSVVILFCCYMFPYHNKFFYFLENLPIFKMKENYSFFLNYFILYLNSLFLRQFYQLVVALFIGFIIKIFVSTYIRMLFFFISSLYVLLMVFLEFYFHKIRDISGNFNLYMLTIFIHISEIFLFWFILSCGGFLGSLVKSHFSYKHRITLEKVNKKLK